jgi:uncharacterized protein YeaO (DUF488 family)
MRAAFAVIVTVCSATIALADDFKTTDGKEYKNVTVSRVEPDGIVIKFSGGIVKIPFTELSRELQEKYHYDPGAAQKFAAQTAEEMNAANANAEELRKKAAAERDQQNAAWAADYQAQQAEKSAEKLLPQIRIFAIITPSQFGKQQTVAWIQPYEQYDTGQRHNQTVSSLNYVPVYGWRKVGDGFTGVIDESMPESYESGNTGVLTLYKIGHTHDSSRHPLFTTKKEKAALFLTTGSTRP